MANQILSKPLLSFPEVIRSRQPKAVFEEKLLALLTVGFRELKIVWDPKAFRGGLNNPKLPSWLLKKLESLISIAEGIDWKLSKSLKEELDVTVEDIETFNPPFRRGLRKSSEDIKAGRKVSQEEMEKRYGIK